MIATFVVVCIALAICFVFLLLLIEADTPPELRATKSQRKRCTARRSVRTCAKPKNDRRFSTHRKGIT